MRFRDRLLAGEDLIGTWVKTPSAIIVEVLSHTPLDVICLDAEHAPFGRLELDGCIAMARAGTMPCLVRTPNIDPSTILNALDCGADGIIAPHICSAEQAEALAKAARFGNGGRGYAGSHRAAGYTTRSMNDNLKSSKEETTVIAQIEDLEALDNLEEIAAVDGIDALFVGRIDLTVAYGAATPKDERVLDAVHRICAAGKKVGKPVGMFTSDSSEIPMWREAGASFYLLGSEQTFILNGARQMRESFDQACDQQE